MLIDAELDTRELGRLADSVYLRI